MNQKLIPVFWLSLFLGVGALPMGAQEAFHGIVPFVTTKAEVEKKFGKRDRYGRYEFEEGTVSINYSEIECTKPAVNCSCFVPVGTVLQVEVSPSSEIRIVDLNLSPKEWESGAVKGHHAEDLKFFSNPKSGVTYYVQAGIIHQIVYDVGIDTCEKLVQKAGPGFNKDGLSLKTVPMVRCNSAILPKAGNGGHLRTYLRSQAHGYWAL